MSKCGRLYTFALPLLLVVAGLACEVTYEPPPPQLTAMWSGTASVETATAAAAPTGTPTATPTPSPSATPTVTLTSSIEEWVSPTGTQWIIELPRFKTEVPR